MTAQVTRINEDNTWGVEVGGYILYKVKDNGEGAKSPRDQFLTTVTMGLISGTAIIPCFRPWS